MIAARVTPAAAAATLRSLINIATPDQIPNTFNGRVCEIQLQVTVGGTFQVTHKSGTVGADDVGFELSGAAPRLSLRARTGNQLSLDDTYLAGGGGTVGIIAYSI